VNIAHRTSGLAGVMLAGPHSTELLSKLSALPVAPSHVAQTSVAKVRAIVVRRDVTGVGSSTAAFELFVDRPFGEYLWDAVLDAGAEFGIRPFGTAALESVGVEF
jgi:glycine cleavage system aminomethyltransferase T